MFQSLGFSSTLSSLDTCITNIYPGLVSTIKRYIGLRVFLTLYDSTAAPGNIKAVSLKFAAYVLEIWLLVDVRIPDFLQWYYMLFCLWNNQISKKRRALCINSINISRHTKLYTMFNTGNRIDISKQSASQVCVITITI